MPTYETQTDLANESRVMQAIADKYGLQLRKCPERYRMDAVFLTGGDIYCLVAFKRRNLASTTYPTFFISLSKAMAAAEIRDQTGIPVYLVVEWTDMIGRIDVRAYSKVTIGGRKDRDDPNDYDLVAHYDIKNFERLDLF